MRQDVKGWAGIAVVAVAAGLAAADAGSYVSLFKRAASVIGIYGVIWTNRRPGPAIVLIAAIALIPRPVYEFADFTLVSTDLALLLSAPGLSVAWWRRRFSLSNWIKGGSATVIIGAVVSACVSPAAPAQVIFGVFRWVLVINFFLAAAAILREQDRRLRDHLLATLILGGVVVAVFGIAQRYGVYTFVGPPYNYPPGRIDSTFGYYSNYANFEAVACLTATATALNGKFLRFKWRLASTGAAVLAAIEVAQSYSRGAALCLAGGVLALVIVLLRRPTRLVALATGAAVAGLAIVIVVPSIILDSFAARFTTAQGEDITRGSEQSAGWSLLTEHPAGVGYGGFPWYVERARLGPVHALAHAHSLWIQVGLEVGWLGLAGFILLVAGSVWAGFRHALTSAESPVIPFLAAIAGFLMQSPQDYFFIETASLIMFAVLLSGLVLPIQHCSTGPLCETQAVGFCNPSDTERMNDGPSAPRQSLISKHGLGKL